MLFWDRLYRIFSPCPTYTAQSVRWKKDQKSTHLTPNPPQNRPHRPLKILLHSIHPPIHQSLLMHLSLPFTQPPRPKPTFTFLPFPNKQIRQRILHIPTLPHHTPPSPLPPTHTIKHLLLPQHRIKIPSRRTPRHMPPHRVLRGRELLLLTLIVTLAQLRRLLSHTTKRLARRNETEIRCCQRRGSRECLRGGRKDGGESGGHGGGNSGKHAP